MKNELLEVIQNQEIALLETCNRKSVAALDKLIADDFIEFGSSGNVYDKAIILRDLPEDEERAEIRYEISDFKANELAANIVLATYKIQKASADEKDMTSSLRSSIWRNENGQWRMVFHQGTVSKK